MIFDVIRFNLFSLDLLREEVHTGREMSIGEYLDREKYGQGFKEDYLFVSEPEKLQRSHLLKRD